MFKLRMRNLIVLRHTQNTQKTHPRRSKFWIRDRLNLLMLSPLNKNNAFYRKHFFNVSIFLSTHTNRVIFIDTSSSLEWIQPVFVETYFPFIFRAIANVINARCRKDAEFFLTGLVYFSLIRGLA